MSDSHLKGWTALDTLESDKKRLWLDVDLYNGLPKTPNMKRSVFIVDVLLESNLGKTSELWGVIDETGSMSVSSIERIGGPNSPAKTFLIAKDLKLPQLFPITSPRLDLFACSNTLDSVDKLKDISLFVHDYRGVILHYTASLDRWLNPQQAKYCFSLKSILTGHRKSVQRLLRTADGCAFLSMSRFSENYLWRSHHLKTSITIRRKCIIQIEQNQTILHASILRNGDFVITMLKDKLVVWDCRDDVAKPIGSKDLESTDKPIVFLLLPESEQLTRGYHVFALYSSKLGNLWRVSLPLPGNTSGYDLITDLGPMEFPSKEQIHMAVRVDPVGWSATVGADHVDTFQRDVLATISPSGTFQSWTATVNKSHKVDWLQTGHLETGKELISRMEVSSIRKVAIADQDATELSIWDTTNSMLEFQKQFAKDTPVSDLDWTSTPDYQSILGVGSAREVTLYTQLRFDYTNKTAAWTPIKKVDISDFTTHRIGDSIWLDGGALAIGAGNQFFIKDSTIGVTDSTTGQLLGKQNVANATNSLFEACTIMNGPLPVYHPQLLIQSIFAGKLDMVKRVLVVLLTALKFGVVLDSKVIDIQSTLGLKPEQLLEMEPPSKELQEAEFNESVCSQLQEWLQRVSLPYMTQHQQITLVSVIEAINQVDQSTASIDQNGLRYLLGYRLFKIHRGIQESMSIRDFNWAFHSESKDVILDIIDNSAMMWPMARDLGLPYWLSQDKLRGVFERIGQNHFSVGNRDPVGCSIFYLALRKRQLLIGLWRTAGWNREQEKTIKLLSNDFNLPKNKVMAQKNAFALLSKHRYEYAAALFLLGDSLKDALNVLVKQVGDLSLAIAVARIYGGDDDPVFKELLEKQILPQAVIDGDRWMASWALWKLDKKDLAIQALERSPREVVKHYVEFDESQGDDNKSFLVDDPVLIILYRYLRKKYFKVLTAPPMDEFQFVLKTSFIYSRMGCDLLSLGMIKNWRFLSTTESPKAVNGRSEQEISEKQPAGLTPASAVAFQEPDMSAFNFGF